MSKYLERRKEKKLGERIFAKSFINMSQGLIKLRWDNEQVDWDMQGQLECLRGKVLGWHWIV